jgi:hypothetical protein
MSWRPLDFSRSVDSKLPALLISTVFRSDSYTVHLTDFSYIWGESLERRDIFQRSQDENTSIDPRDGDQLHILLDKIKLGIEGGRDTALTLAVNDNTGRPGITLNITVPLPGGLEPLEWPVHLTALSQSLLGNQLIIPLLEAQQMRMRELASLADIIREKDHVIQKLVDKLESQGTQLGQVFPQAAAKAGRKIDRKKAEEKVQGLSHFDIEVWRQGLEKEESRDVRQLVEQVFKSGSFSYLDNKGARNVLKGPENWWEDVKGGSFTLSTGKSVLHEESKTSKDRKIAKSMLEKEESIQDDDNFQAQATPPHLASTAQKSALERTIDDSTEDDDDLDAPSQRSKIPDSFPSSPTPPHAKSHVKVPKKLGIIGGKKESPKPAPKDNNETTESSSSPRLEKSHSPERRTESPDPKPDLTKPKRALGRIGGKKAPPELEASLPSVNEPTKPKRGRLGQVGGKRKEATPGSAEPQPDAETAVSPPKPTSGAKQKLGSDAEPGTKEVGEERGGVGSEEPRGRALKQEKEEPPPRETSEERADRKREQLKMQLEEKAKAPVKKKRKF